MTAYLTPQQVAAMPDARYSAAYIENTKTERAQYMYNWKRDITDLYNILDGKWSSVFPARVKAERYDSSLKVQNLVSDALYDFGRLFAAARPTIVCDPLGRSDTKAEEAKKREAIAGTYWRANASDRKVARLGMDLFGTGGAFLLHYADYEEDGKTARFPYPKHMRLEPMYAFPDVVDDEMQDFLYVKTLKLRMIDRLFPWLGLKVRPDDASVGELYTYYAPDQTVRVVKRPGNANPALVATVEDNPLGVVPVSWCKLPTGDGAWRGVVLQAAPVVNQGNRLVTMLMDNSERATYAPRKERGALNPESYGPDAIVHLDPTLANSDISMVEPAPLQPALFNLRDGFETSARGGLNYPASRNAANLPSIVSAAGIDAMQGGEIALIQQGQTEFAAMRERGIKVDFLIDKEWLNFEKPLMVPSGEAETYRPKMDIGTNYYAEVVYGLGQGLSTINAAVMLEQQIGNKLISRRTARAQMPNIPNANIEEDLIAEEAALDVLLQQVAADPNPMMKYMLAAGILSGANRLEVFKQIFAAATQQQQQAQEQPGQLPGGPPAPGQLPPGTPGPPQETALPAQQASSLAAGGIPGNAPNLRGSFTAPVPFSALQGR